MRHENVDDIAFESDLSAIRHQAIIHDNNTKSNGIDDNATTVVHQTHFNQCRTGFILENMKMYCSF